MRDKKIFRSLLVAIILTILPFFLLLTTIDHTLINTDLEVYLLQLSGVLGNIFGFIGLVLLFWQFILGVRFISRFFTPDLVSMTKVHTFIGKYGLLLVLLHPVLVMYSYLEDILWIFLPNLSSSTGIFIGLGRIALILLFVIYVTSALLRSKMKYRPWLYLHYLAYPIILFVFIHSLQVGTFLEEIIPLRVLWVALFATFIILTIYRIIRAAGFLGNWYKISEIKELGNDLYEIALTLAGESIPQIAPGQFFYIQMRRFGESHPFSLMSFDNGEKELRFAFNVVGRFTKGLSMKKVGESLNLDGPYGVFTKEAQNNQPKVILAGGIGITPFIQLLKEHSNEDTFLFYSVSKMEDIIEEDLLRKFLGTRFFICNSKDKSDKINATNCRIDANVLNESLPEGEIQKYNYFICGSKEYVVGMKKLLSELQIPKEQIFYEEFEL